MTAEDPEHESDPEEGTGIWARQTAPQTEFTTSQVGIGFVVLAIGFVVAFVLPLLLV